MKTDRAFSFQSEVWLPRPMDEVFAFFADASNLQAITPPWLDFTILTPSPISIRQGTLIDYRLRLRGIPLRWQTEITVWEPPFRFIDEQKKGPYSFWIHEHRFAARGSGTQMLDLVRYYPPGGWLTNKLFVRRDVEAIFNYRSRKLNETFA